MESPTGVYRSINKLREFAEPGDVLLYRRGFSLSNFLIARAGRGPWVHAGILDWENGRPIVLHTLQGRGAVMADLTDAVAKHPGQWDVFRPIKLVDHFIDRGSVVAYMRGIRGKRYGWWALAKAFARHAIFLRLFVKPETDDKANGSMLPFCSMAVATAWRHGKLDLVPNLSDRLTEPSDLARSAFLQRAFSLVPKCDTSDKSRPWWP